MFQSVGIDIHTLKSVLNKIEKKQLTGILGQIRSNMQTKTDQQRMHEAEKHFMNALYYRAPRHDNLKQGQQHLLFNFVYFIQTSYIWQKVLLFFSYVFMYLILLTHRKPAPSQAVAQYLILLLFWFDVGMEVFHKKYDVLRNASKFQSRFFIKIGVLTLLIFDQILATVVDQENYNFVRLFLVLRCFLPALYDTELRKNIQAILALYKDILVFALFYFLVMLIFTTVAHQLIGSPQKQIHDPFTQNYDNLGRTLFLMYTLSAFESFPDNQLKFLREHAFSAVFFIVFIFLNMFLFLIIPTSILFEGFKNTRSKIILVDQIKQQNSLIFSFCCLCEGNLEIERTKFMKFLLGCFKNKMGYLSQIAKIALEVDQNQNQKIQIAQFIQILKIIHSHPSLYPPLFPDYHHWTRFRENINEKYKIKLFVTSTKFKIGICIFILFTICNCILCVYTHKIVFFVFDKIITVLFVFELVLKIVAIGPENCFKDPWNKLDFFVVGVTVGFEVFRVVPINVLVKMFRFYRLALLPKYTIDKGKYVSLDHFIVRISRLITQILMTIPIVIQFFPVYLISFYFWGVIGLQIYSPLTPSLDDKSSPYSIYYQISNFNSFLYSQFFLVQILIDAGWSVVAYDYCYRYPIPIWFTMIFFSIVHFSITLILSSLIKGVTWEVYETVQKQLNNEATKQLEEQRFENSLNNKFKLVNQIRVEMNVNKQLTINNLISRQIFQAKVDQIIIEKMKEALKNPRSQYMKSISQPFEHKNNLFVPVLNKRVTQTFMDSLNLTFQNKSSVDSNLSPRNNSLSIGFEGGESLVFRKQKSSAQDQLHKQIEELVDEANFQKTKAYNQVISYPSHLLKFLRQKIKPIATHIHQTSIKQMKLEESSRVLAESDRILRSNFKLQKHEITKNEQSTLFLTHSIRSLLEMKNSPEEERAKIIDSMVEGEIIDGQLGRELKKRNRNVDMGWVNPDWILRQVFLDQTSQKLVEKQEIQYFTKIYGDNFKEINRETIKPLLRFQSKITYCFRNILRHQKINSFHFFTMLSQIQNQISYKLLRRGSMFKFVYQIDCFEDCWFSFQLKQKQNQRVIRAHFIKNGIWIWHKDLPENQINISEDFFNWDTIQKRNQIPQFRKVSSESEQLIKEANEQRCVKMLFQSFETLAMTLKDRDHFFVDNPSFFQYSLFCYYKNVVDTNRWKGKRFCVSKIMAVVLSNEGKRMFEGREDPLCYDLSEINIEGKLKNSRLSQTYTKDLDESYSQIFERVGKLETLDEQEIGEDQKLPFSYIVNLMQQIKDTMNLYQHNFAKQVQSMINESNALMSISMQSAHLQQSPQISPRNHPNPHPQFQLPPQSPHMLQSISSLQSSTNLFQSGFRLIQPSTHLILQQGSLHLQSSTNTNLIQSGTHNLMIPGGGNLSSRTRRINQTIMETSMEAQDQTVLVSRNLGMVEFVDTRRFRYL